MTRIYFTLDGRTVEATDAEFENDAKSELESAIAAGNHKAKLLLETDGTDDFNETYFRLENAL